MPVLLIIMKKIKHKIKLVKKKEQNLINGKKDIYIKLREL